MDVMVRYDVETAKATVNEAFANLMMKIETLKKVAVQNGYPVRTITATGLKIRRYGKIFQYQEFQKRTKRVADKRKQIEWAAEQIFMVDIEYLRAVGLTDERQIKKAVIKHEHEKGLREGMRMKTIKSVIAYRYKMTETAVEKIIYRK